MTIVFEKDDSRFVQLSAEYDFDRWDGGSIELLTAEIEKKGVTLIRMSSDEQPEKFELSAKEADAFVVAWTTYKADQQAKLEAEAERQKKTIADAYALAKEHPLIKVEEGPVVEGKPSFWRVSVPETGYNLHYPAYSADDFLEAAVSAKEEVERHQKRLANQPQSA